MDVLKTIVLSCCIMFFLSQNSCTAQNYHDVEYYSAEFSMDRAYRIYLPAGYEQNSGKRYPVIYYFHGYGGRYKWDSYAPEDDVHFPENGREDPPYVMEWSDYTRNNEVIIVTWDGYEPNLHPSRKEREGLKYGTSRPYDYDIAHQEESTHWGWDFRKYFRELVSMIDRTYRTIPDRQHRAITGLSMGGQMAYYIAGQSKDLVSTVSAFDPADNIAMYGPKGKQVAFPIRELYRGLEGLKVRLTMTDGDWLKYNDKKLKDIFESAYPKNFSFHLADYPDHWAADIPQQLDFHMEHFGKNISMDSWSHISPFPSFDVLGYSVALHNADPAIVAMEKDKDDILKVKCQSFIPDGPICEEAVVDIVSPGIYDAGDSFKLLTYNMVTNAILSHELMTSSEGKLDFSLEGGAHIVGVNNINEIHTPRLRWISTNDPAYHYFEEGRNSSLDLKLINLGLGSARNVFLTAYSPDDKIEFLENEIRINEIRSGDVIDLANAFDFSLRKNSDTSFMSSIDIVVSVDGEIVDSQKLLYYPIPASPFAKENDIIILDGRTVENFPVYHQGPNEVEHVNITGGHGNGDGKWESGETALLYVKLNQGLAPNDTNTFHRTFLMDSWSTDYVEVRKLDYKVKKRQAGATSIASPIYLSEECPENYELNLWLKVESLYNDPDDPTSKATIYAHKDDYRKVRLQVNTN